MHRLQQAHKHLRRGIFGGVLIAQAVARKTVDFGVIAVVNSRNGLRIHGAQTIQLSWHGWRDIGAHGQTVRQV